MFGVSGSVGLDWRLVKPTTFKILFVSSFMALECCVHFFITVKSFVLSLGGFGRFLIGVSGLMGCDWRLVMRFSFWSVKKRMGDVSVLLLLL